MTNPFTNRSMIKDKTCFVGRIRELEDIVPRLRTGNCVSIVGDRRIGKSSLLFHLYQTGTQLLEDDSAAFQFIYIDLLDPSVKTAEGFVSMVLYSLDIDYDEEKMAQKPTLWLTRALRANRHKVMPILMIDEFDKVEEIHELYNNDFLEALRAICNEGNLCIVTASKTPLKDIITKGNLVSQLWNIFMNMNLKEFAVDDVLDERALFLLQMWQEPFMPTEEEKQFLLSYTSTHPLIMQIVSHYVFQNRMTQFKSTEEQLRKKIEAETKSYFKDTNDKIKEWLVAKKETLPKQIEWSSEFLGKILKNLLPLKDLKLF